jgi:beta-aspartyl-peptidase (threonine type)
MGGSGWALIVHGGAGDWAASRQERALEGTRRAAAAGARILAEGGSSADAVVAAAVILEDDPTFGAGTGSAPNIDGLCELDASLMLGEGLRVGGVANLQGVRNPILVARRVLEETDHVLLAGEGALRFARACGFGPWDPSTPESRELYRERMAKLRSEGEPWLPRHRELLEKYPDLARGTIGAVAVDATGRFAAATSTGGVTLKLAGRIGDVPMPGAGNYATGSGAASATGRGELCMRALATKVACDRLESGHSATDAAAGVISYLRRTVGPDAGIIAVDRAGRVGAAHGTSAMPHAWWEAAMTEPGASMVGQTR